MANIKSSQKDIRRTATRTLVNKASRSRLKTLSKTARETIKGGDAKKTGESIAATVSAFDKAVKTGVIHKNKASRLKSRLTKAAAKAQSAKTEKSA
jgi:small subunit ribosomal protein S20